MPATTGRRRHWVRLNHMSVRAIAWMVWVWRLLSYLCACLRSYRASCAFVVAGGSSPFAAIASLQSPPALVFFSDAVFDALEADAQGRYEVALEGYSAALADVHFIQRAHAYLGPGTTHLLVDRSLNCLLALRDWARTVQWVTTLHGNRKKIVSSSPTDAGADANAGTSGIAHTGLISSGGGRGRHRC